MENEKNKAKDLAEDLHEAVRKKATDFSNAAYESAEKVRRK